MDIVGWTEGIGISPIVALEPTQHLLANGILGAGAVGSLIFCLYIAIRKHKMFPVYLFITSAICAWYEIWVNVVGRCSWAVAGEPIIYQAMGRSMPLFHLLVYLFYFPVVATLLWLAFERGVTQKRWWTWLGIAIPGAIIFEIYPVNHYWWFYYGAGQPVSIINYPIWWAPCAMVAVFGASAVSYMMRQFLGEKYTVPIIFVAFPLLVVALHMFCAFPVFVALSSSTSLLVTTPAAVLTIALALCELWFIGRVLEKQTVREKVEAAVTVGQVAGGR